MTTRMYSFSKADNGKIEASEVTPEPVPVYTTDQAMKVDAQVSSAADIIKAITEPTTPLCMTCKGELTEDNYCCGSGIIGGEVKVTGYCTACCPNHEPDDEEPYGPAWIDQQEYE